MNRRFLVGVVALLLLFMLIDYRMPRHFVWEPTFGHTDPQPFGALLFDSVLTASLPQGYTVTRQTLWQLQHDSSFMARPHGILVLTSEYNNERRQVMELAKEGHVLLIAAGNNALGLEDTLDISITWHNRFSAVAKPKLTADCDTLVWVAPDSDALTVSVMSDMLEWGMTVGDSLPWQPLIAGLGENTCFAASLPIGKGEIIVVSSPLLLTNYGMLNPQERLLIGRLMGRMQHLPVVRTTAYTQSTAFTEQSPFYVLLQRPPLRWALYLSVLTILLFMGFTARRRQRVIPVIDEPKNGNLEFVRLIGTLNYQRRKKNTKKKE